MHRSRLSAIVIDCLDEQFEECVAFWAAAFGGPPPRKPAKRQRYVKLKAHPGDLDILLQRVERDPGIHLDFESDSVSREAERLEAAGAERKYRIKSWWVMQDPGDNAFCVIRKQKPELLEKSEPWPDGSA
ncbi:MAG TPA: VOC family protein [Gammaproteobacteria bacterium]|nr:VOC family protein [Gammaproteobacteria bacterium]